MKDVKLLCERVIEAHKKDGHSHYTSQHSEFQYITIAANSAERLAKACLMMSEALESIIPMNVPGNQRFGPEQVIANEALNKADAIARGEE